MVDRLDAFQRRHGWVGLPLAVIYNFFDDQGPYLAALITLVVGVLVTTALGAASNGAVAYGASFGLVRVGAVASSVAAATGLCLIAFRVLTACATTLRQLLPGALGAAVAWQVLQLFGAYYIKRVVQGTDELYGLFGLVFGLLAWSYLQAIVLVLVTEVIVVRAHRLWPRALLTPLTDAAPLSGADKRAYRQYARAQRFKGYEGIDVDLSGSPRPPREPN